ncbi:transcriptional regulator [Brumimicrobium salinarum]|uniref:Transcriptional regulator n=1 Tax=Brumimicrobium salinarum TaxID=2058658 RepID=A0A2I0R2A8_9FLAO|nr:RNA-binding domain-containing protein [Brumimicrobium salinarum]PKR80718.1 transcriptional regulator [Brumimicrobium salinarum]
MPETNRIEFKEKLTKEIDLEKEVIAFLNYNEGGFIYIGIDKMGTVVGVKDIDGDMLKIKDRLKTNIIPSCMGLFDISSEEKDGKDIIKITVASGSEKPYYKRKYGMSEKGAYIRNGTAADPMPQKMIDELFAKRTKTSIGKIRSSRQDLTFEQLKIYYEGKGITLNKNFAKNLELLTEKGEYNYVAYLMADENGTSIKLAKYNGLTRVDLTENPDFGYESLIKATKQVLDKIEIENKSDTSITSAERIDKRPWSSIALREAILNAFVHNDYTTEVPPKFEIFDDRIEITSTGGLPNGLSKDEFFEGFSVPRNKELMRIYKDLELVEQLGSGVPRILEYYGRECFKFSENFLRMTFPKEDITPQVKTMPVKESDESAPQVTPQVTPQVKKLIWAISDEMGREEIQTKLNLSDKRNYRENYQKPAINLDLIEMTIPEKPNSSLQKYRLTDKGKELKKLMSK